MIRQKVATAAGDHQLHCRVFIELRLKEELRHDVERVIGVAGARRRKPFLYTGVPVDGAHSTGLVAVAGNHQLYPTIGVKIAD